MRTYMCYYIDYRGFREGVEIITAASKEEAEATYRRQFNVVEEKVNVVPRYEPPTEGVNG